jgi:hypothetical protein
MKILTIDGAHLVGGKDFHGKNDGSRWSNMCAVI